MNGQYFHYKTFSCVNLGS